MPRYGVYTYSKNNTNNLGLHWNVITANWINPAHHYQQICTLSTIYWPQITNMLEGWGQIVQSSGQHEYNAFADVPNCATRKPPLSMCWNFNKSRLVYIMGEHRKKHYTQLTRTKSVFGPFGPQFVKHDTTRSRAMHSTHVKDFAN